MKKILYWEDVSSIKLVVQAIKNNELIVGTTDTILGLFASVTVQGKLALDRVKKRERKPYIILLSEKKIKNILIGGLPIENILYSVIKNFWPGPLTIIFDSCDIVQEGLLDQDTVAIRVPDHAGISLMLEELEMVFSTSANLAGQLVPLKIEDISAEIAQEAAFFIIDKQPRAEQLPSTIIRYDKYNNEKPITIVREGAISRKLLASVSDELQYLLKDE